VWNPNLLVTASFRDQWSEVPDNAEFDNGFKAKWEDFIRDVVAGRPHVYDFFAAARKIQLAEAGLKPSADGRRVELEPLTL
jgi:predicted dehydrogenase